jgi:hypothetical protein
VEPLGGDRRPARVLIVDADHEVRALIADVLRIAGHNDVECVYRSLLRFSGLSSTDD